MANRFLLCKSSITCTISATTDIILTAALSTPCRAGKPETSSYIVRNETNGSYAIEQFLARIILGNSYGVWDKLNAPAEAGAGMKLHHGIFQQVFHIAAENTGQLVEDVCLRLVNAIDPLFVHLNVAQIHAGLLCKLCLR